MKKCKNCGNLVNDEDRFCKYCSYEFEDVKENVEKDETEKLDLKDIRKTLENRESPSKKSNESKEQEEKETKKDLKEKKQNKKIYDKIPKKSYEKTENDKENKDKSPKRFSIASLIILIIVISLVGFGVKASYNKALENVDTPLKVVEKFENYLNNNPEKLKEIMASADDSIELTDKDIDNFYNLLKEDEDYKNNLLAKLNEEATSIENKEEYDSTGSIKLIESNEKTLGKSNYKIGLSTIETVEDNPDWIKSTISGAKTENRFFPGIYVQTFNTQDLEFKRNVKIYDESSYFIDDKIDLSYNGFSTDQLLKEFEVTSGNKDITIRTLGNNDATVFVNGKSTGLTVDQFNDINPKNVKEGSILQIIRFGENGIDIGNQWELGSESWVILHLVSRNGW
ncbi:MAG: hypothetical protein Q4B36_08025 [Tissierellia bacterium]|nr:hypothetical protein [Tissierellia bacterium]